MKIRKKQAVVMYMKAKKNLKKQIIIEIVALIFFVTAIIYAIVALGSNGSNKVSNFDGVVAVLDDKNQKNIKICSDGEGLDTEGTTYTVTNNRKKKISYKLIIEPNVHDEKVLKNLRLGIDDLYVINLSDLEREDGGYILLKNELDTGYTEIHSTKMWYQLKSNKENTDSKIKFNYKIVMNE